MMLDPKFMSHLESKYGFDLETEQREYEKENPLFSRTPKEIFDICLYEISKASEIPESIIIGKSRKREHTLPRHMLMWVSRMRDIATFKTLGEWFGGMDHSSIMHGVDVIEDMLETRHVPAMALREKITHLIT